MKPYLVMEYLLRNTDENHAERRSIYRDIDKINKTLWLLENEDDDATIFDAEKAINADEYENEKFMAKDESRHGKAFTGLLKRYFG